jgi:hypothetical protein
MSTQATRTVLDHCVPQLAPWSRAITHTITKES